MENIAIYDVFSYWIIVWFLLYVLYPRKVYNPVFALMVGLLENVLMSVYLVLVDAPMYLLYILSMCLTKSIPLYIIYKYYGVEWEGSIKMSVCLFVIYSMCLWVKGTSVIEVYSNIFKSVKEGGMHTPFYQIMSYVGIVDKR